MSYQTGTAETLSDLLFKLSEFAIANGWTVDKFTPHVTTPELYLHNAGGFYSFGTLSGYYSSVRSLIIYGNTGYSDSVAFNTQPGNSRQNQGFYNIVSYNGTHVTEMTGPFLTYDFFGTSQYLHVVVQIGAARFRHFGIGQLNKEGDWSGGEYVFGTLRSQTSPSYPHNDQIWGVCAPGQSQSRYSAVVRAEGIAGQNQTPWWLGASKSDIAGATVRGAGHCGTSGSTLNQSHPDSLQIYSSLSTFGQVLAPVPNSILAYGLDQVWRRLGTLPDCAQCRMDGITPRTILKIAGEEWMIIPPTTYRANAANGPDSKNDDSSGEAGVAYRIIR